MKKLEHGLSFKADELLELVGPDNFDFIKSIGNVITYPDGSLGFIFFYKNEGSYLTRIITYINNNSLSLAQSGPLYKFCYFLNPIKRGINFNLLNYYLITGKLIKAIPHALVLIETYRFEKDVYNDNGLYVCIFYDIINHMIKRGTISIEQLTSEDIKGMEKIKNFVDTFRETTLISLLEGSLYSMVSITDDNISAIIELALNGYYSLAYILSRSISNQNNPYFVPLKRFLNFYNLYVFDKISSKSRMQKTDMELWLLIVSKRYRVLKEIYSAPFIASYLSTRKQYKQKIGPMKRIIEELLKLESMTKEEILAYAEEASRQNGEEKELYDMILNGEFISAYKKLSECDGNGNKKMYFLLETLYDAVMGNIMNPLDPNHVLILQTMANIKQLN